MSIFKGLFGGSTNPITAIGEAGDALFTSDEERAQLSNELAEIKQKPLLMQALANVTAANHRTVFVAGGRPALLWVAALGLFFFFPVKFAFGTLLWMRHSWGANEMLAFPFAGDGLMELVSMLLGLGVMRTVEKLAGKAK
jgi:hypothetical protein